MCLCFLFANPFGHRFDKIPQPLMFADGVRRQHLKERPHFDHFICIPCNQHALVEKDLNLLERSCPGHFTYLKDKEKKAEKAQKIKTDKYSLVVPRPRGRASTLLALTLDQDLN